MDVYKSLNISTGTVMKNSEMLKFVPDFLKTKEMCKHAVKKLCYLLRYVPDLILFLIVIKLKKCVMKLLMIL